MNFTISSCSEGRTWDVHSSSLLIDVYALFSDISHKQRLQWPELRNSRTLCIKSDVNLFNHWLGKADVAVIVLRVLFFDCMSCPVFSVLICIVWSCFYVKLMQIIIAIPAYNWLFDVVWWPPRTLWYVDDNHYHFTGPFRWKKGTKKNIVVSSEP